MVFISSNRPPRPGQHGLAKSCLVRGGLRQAYSANRLYDERRSIKNRHDSDGGPSSKRPTYKLKSMFPAETISTQKKSRCEKRYTGSHFEGPKGLCRDSNRVPFRKKGRFRIYIYIYIYIYMIYIALKIYMPTFKILLPIKNAFRKDEHLRKIFIL